MTRLQTLQNLQNRAARIVTRSNFDSSAKPLIHNLKWPTINDIIRSETATIMYKSLNGLAPEYLSKRFINNSTRSVRQLRNTDTDLLLPLRKTSNGQRGISFRGFTWCFHSFLQVFERAFQQKSPFSTGGNDRLKPGKLLDLI